MQNKGAIRLFAIALALVCLFELSFTFVTSKIRSDAKDYALAKFEQKKTVYQNLTPANFEIRKQEFVDSTSGHYLDSIGTEKVWLWAYTFNRCQEKELNLGLDLKGGMNVTLEVSVVDLIKNMAGGNSTDPVFVSALDLAIKNQKNSQKDLVSLFGEAFETIAPKAKLSSLFNTPELRGRINFNSTNEEVIAVIKKEAGDAISNSFNILRSRIDRFGVTQPNIQLLEGSGRILIELPGVKERERVRKLLQGTANLEFWETYDNKVVFDNLQSANSRIKDILSARKGGDTTSVVNDTTKVTNQNEISMLLDSTKTVKDSSLISKINDTINKGNENVQFEQFRKDNPLFALLKPMVNQQGQLMDGASVGYAHFKDTALINAYLNMKQIKDIFPRDVRFAWGVKSPQWDKSGTNFELVALKANREGKCALGGDVITNAREEFGQVKATAEVTMTMNGDGARKWARITKENIGKQIAIVLDDYVYSYPVVQGEISGGSSQITGNFTIQEAKDLANILKSGKMPAPARIIQEEIVGPSLGEESINNSFLSFLIAFFCILAFMVIYYSGAGFIANAAMALNLFFIFGILASLGAVLTLPGIAGIVLTMAMAVDANVLIYERVLEEINLGKGLKLAVHDGFRHALSAIIDSHVTALITGVILYIFGSGPIQGFATTTIIGIVTSLFTSILVSRLIIEWYMGKNRNIGFTTSYTKNFLTNTKLDFIGMRKYFYIISSVVILVGLISIVTRGFDLGIDFKGGRTYVIRFEEKIPTNKIQEALRIEFGSAPEVKTFGSENQIKVSTKFHVEDNSKDVDSLIESKFFAALKPFYKENIDLNKFTASGEIGIMSSQKVGPTIADDIKVAAVWAVLIALIGIFFYIFARFKNWKFGLGALVSLAHDVLLVLGVYSLFFAVLPFSLEIDQHFIAAILTILGYSIMDTVVVYDRVREYVNLGKRWNRKDTYNFAINSTLRRTINTSITTLLTITAMFIFGGEVIRGFMFALLIGIGTGTYSSIFVATAIVYDTEKYFDKDEKVPVKEAKVKTVVENTSTVENENV